MKYQIASARIAKPAAPPTVPPAIAPVFVDFELELGTLVIAIVLVTPFDVTRRVVSATFDSQDVCSLTVENRTGGVVVTVTVAAGKFSKPPVGSTVMSLLPASEGT